MRKAKAGDTLDWTVFAYNPLTKREALTARFEGRGFTADQTLEFDLAPSATVEKPLRFTLSDKIPKGRHVFTFDVRSGAAPAGADAILVVDVD